MLYVVNLVDFFMEQSTYELEMDKSVQQSYKVEIRKNVK